RGVEEIDFEVQEGFDEVGEGVDGVAVAAIQGDDEVAGGTGEAAFVGATIAANVFTDHFGTERGGDLAVAVGGIVKDHDHRVHEVGHSAENGLDALFLVQTGNDHGDR